MSDAVEEAPLAQFKSALILSLEEGNLELFEDLVKEVASESGKTPVEVAAACARLTRRAEEPGVLERIAGYELQKSRPDAKVVRPVTAGDDSTPYRGQGTSEFRPRGNDHHDQGEGQGWKPVEEGMTRLFVNVGRMDGVRPGDLVGAIAGESGIEGSSIGSIDIFSRYSFVEVPEDQGEQIISSITGVQVRGRAVQARPATPPGEGGGGGGGYRGGGGGGYRGGGGGGYRGGGGGGYRGGGGGGYRGGGGGGYRGGGGGGYRGGGGGGYRGGGGGGYRGGGGGGYRGGGGGGGGYRGGGGGGGGYRGGGGGGYRGGGGGGQHGGGGGGGDWQRSND